MATAKSVETRDRILRSAAAVLANNGYAGTSMEAIAERAATKAGSLYYHFAGKDDLVTEVLVTGVSTAHAAVNDVLAENPAADPVARIRMAVRAHMRAVLSQGPFTKANIRGYGQVPVSVSDRVRGAQRRYGQLWADMIEQAVHAGVMRDDLNQSAVRLLMLGAMNWTVEWVSDNGPLDSGQLSDQFSDMVLDGLVKS